MKPILVWKSCSVLTQTLLFTDMCWLKLESVLFFSIVWKFRDWREMVKKGKRVCNNQMGGIHSSQFSVHFLSL